MPLDGAGKAGDAEKEVWCDCLGFLDHYRHSRSLSVLARHQRPPKDVGLSDGSVKTSRNDE